MVTNPSDTFQKRLNYALNEWKGLPLDMRLINFRAIIG